MPAPQLHFTHTIRSLTFLPFGSRQIRTGNPQKFSYFPTYHTTGFHTLLPYLPSNPIICPHRLSPSHPHLSVPTTHTLFHTLSPPFHTNYFFLPPFHPIFAPVSLQRRVPKSRIVKRVGKEILCNMAWIEIAKEGGFSTLNKGEKAKLLALLNNNEIPIGSYEPNTEYRIDRQSIYSVNEKNFQGGKAFDQKYSLYALQDNVRNYSKVFAEVAVPDFLDIDMTNTIIEGVIKSLNSSKGCRCVWVKQ